MLLAGAASIPDWLALVGDDADGIPGVPKWGAQSASTPLAYYAHVEAIPVSAADWQVKVCGADALAQSLAGLRPRLQPSSGRPGWRR